LAEKLAASNPDSMRGLKEVMWEGTDYWDSLLVERAAMSGKRVLSEFTRNILTKLKKG
jgi:methylglutaconyl-CoA hydratase